MSLVCIMVGLICFLSFVIESKQNMDQIIESPRKNGKCRLNEIIQAEKLCQ